MLRCLTRLPPTPYLLHLAATAAASAGDSTTLQRFTSPRMCDSRDDCSRRRMTSGDRLPVLVLLLMLPLLLASPPPPLMLLLLPPVLV